jgi:regulatory protein
MVNIAGRNDRSRFPLGRGVWHKNGVMTPARTRKQRPPLDQVKLQELALRYVERFATTRAKLHDYLRRKLRERGWKGDCEADLTGIADEFARLGYVDDAAYALNQSRTLAGRGYGKRRLEQKLRVAGVAEPDGEDARAHADAEAVSSALRFAERRRLGPFASEPRSDPREREKAREKALAAMIRAGHGFDLAKAIIALSPGAEIDPDELRERARLT